VAQIASFLRYIQFERESVGEDQGHRQLLAERDDYVRAGALLVAPPGAPATSVMHLHALAREFELSETEILDLISDARRLRMAVRGWVAETHLERQLRSLPGVAECQRIDDEGSPDLKLRLDVGRRFISSARTCCAPGPLMARSGSTSNGPERQSGTPARAITSQRTLMLSLPAFTL